MAKGNLTAVMGPSGSGKSTLMHILAGLDKPTSGTVAVSGTEITTLKDSDLTKLRRRHIGFVFQFFNLLPMLTAEENITLPLSIAGEKADPEFFRGLIDKVGLADRLHHRPSELSGGQQQRVAIARALVSRPTVLFADEPTGNLDSATGTEILALMRDSVDSYGQTTVMVTHEPRAAAIADRILFLADGVVVRDLPGASQAEVLSTLTRDRRSVTKFALKGLLGRKLRTALTAFAIVLGVAMVSGTFVLTDSIDKAFDSIFTESRAGSTAVITGKSAFDISEGSGASEPLLDESLLPKVREVSGVGAAEGSVDGEAQIIGDDGKAIVYGGAPNLGFSIANGDSVFNPLTLDEGKWPGPGEVAIDEATADKENFDDRPDGRRPGRRAGRASPHLRLLPVRLGLDDRRRHARRLRPADGTADLRQARQARRDRCGRGTGCPGGAARRGHQEDPAAYRRGQARLRAGEGGRSETRTVHHLPPGLPARLRRHRALRRQLRDRELALDHDRAAHP